MFGKTFYMINVVLHYILYEKIIRVLLLKFLTLIFNMLDDSFALSVFYKLSCWAPISLKLYTNFIQFLDSNFIFIKFENICH